ncbi:MAG: hypothetical protein ACI8X5_000833 [Planctomycetota bacterium]|jgi:hypothetical protein
MNYHHQQRPMNYHHKHFSFPRLLGATVLATVVLGAVSAQSESAAQPADLPTSAVSPVGLLPQAVTSFGATVEAGWLYVLGGFFGTPHEYDNEGQSRSFARMNLVDGSWEALPSAGAMQSVALVSDSEMLYRVGGMVVHNASGEEQRLESVAKFGQFDPLSGEWTELPPLPSARSSHMAAVLDGSVWVVGGWQLHPEEDAAWQDTILRFDLDDAEGEWEAIPAPFRRRALGVCTAAGRVIAVGGMSEDGITNEVDVFEPSTGTWSKGPKYPGSAFGLSATSVGNMVYASGGDGTLFRWLVGEDEWHLVTSLIFPRFFHQLVPSSDRELLAIGGVARGSRIRHVESIALDAVKPRVQTTVWTLPAPGNAKNRQGVFLRDNSLFVFGGNNSLGQHDFAAEQFVDESFKLNLTSLSWSRIQQFPVRRQSMQAALSTKGDVGFAIGGFGHDGNVARTHADLYRYDVKYDTWSALPAALPAPRSQFGLVEYDEAFWLFGGLDYNPTREEGDQFRHPLDVLRWESTSDDSPSCEVLGVELPRPRRAFGSALLSGRCYLVGGLREGFEAVEECDVFDFEARSWSQIPAPRSPRISPELVSLGGRLFMAGGSSDKGDGFEADQCLEVFDPVTGEWSVLMEELPVEARHLRMFAYGDRLLLYSAHHEEQLVQVAILDVGSTSLESHDVSFHTRR